MRQGNTTTIEAPFLWRGCRSVFKGSGHKAKRLVLQCINGVSSNPVSCSVTLSHKEHPVIDIKHVSTRV
jgi:hypothetical protein